MAHPINHGDHMAYIRLYFPLFSHTPCAIIFFSIGDDSYKDWKVNKKLSLKQVMMIGSAFLLAVAIVYVLLQLAGFLISDVLHLTGPAKVIMQFLLWLSVCTQLSFSLCVSS